MKRYISLFLAAVVLIFSLAVPAYAAEFENPYGINLMDYYVFNTFSVSSTNTPVTFDLPLKSFYYAVDMIVASYSGFDNVYFQRDRLISLNVAHIGGDLYRIYGPFEKLNTDEITLVFDCVSSSNITVQSFHVYYSPVQFFDAAIEAIGGAGPDNDFDLSLNYGDTRPTYTQYTVPWEYATFNLSISAPYWDRYDFLDVVLYMNVADISSISASFGGVVIPLDVSYLPSSDGLDPTYILSLRLDFRGLDRTGEDPPLLRITGVSNTDGLNYISLWNAKGGIILDTVKPLPFFFNSLFSRLTTWFGNVGTWISNQTSSLTNSLSGWFSNVGTWISNQTSTLTSSLSTLFGNVGTWISNQTSTLTNSLSTWFSNVDSWIDSQTNSITSSISSWGQKIVDAILGDSSDADKFQQQVDDSNKELSDMSSVMNSFTTPDINSINVDVGSFVSPSDINSLTAPMSLLFESDIVITCIMISIILATVMFVLYGKR